MVGLKMGGGRGRRISGARVALSLVRPNCLSLPRRLAISEVFISVT